MTLTNYWWLLIWLFVGGAFLVYFIPKRQEVVLGNREERWSVPAALILVIPYIVAAALRTDAMVGDSRVSSKVQKNFFIASALV